VTTDSRERPEVSPCPLSDLKGLTLTQIADLDADALDEWFKRILPESPSVPVAAFNSAI